MVYNGTYSIIVYHNPTTSGLCYKNYIYGGLGFHTWIPKMRMVDSFTHTSRCFFLFLMDVYNGQSYDINDLGVAPWAP
jgi:hypothetical protein